MFQERFASLVESGQKRQTVRSLGKPNHRPPRAGEELSLRTWSGKPYRSKQRILLSPVTCAAVRPIFIGICHDAFDVRVDHESVPDLDAFARADGFADAADMRQWFTATHGLPFVGRLIQW